MRRWLAVLLAAVLLAGCSGPDPGTSAILNAHLQPGAGRKSIGVISAIGDRYYLQKVGITVFGNEEKTLPKTIHGPSQPVDKSWWPASPQDAQVARLRDTTRTLVEQSLRMTLAEVLPTQ